jgi:hypothetical protein
MFWNKPPAEKTKLEELIDELLNDMANTDSTTDEYAKMVKQLKKLYALKDLDRPKGPSADTLLIVAGNLAVTVLVVGHERANIITSKALNFLHKAR